MLVVIKGAGDLASGVACRLARCGFSLVMTETAAPTTVRCSVAFSRAVYVGTATVEGQTACLARDAQEALRLTQSGKIAVLVDEKAAVVKTLAPSAVVDAILAKRNLGTSRTDAPIVVALGPGFTVGEDCHAVVETKRGHDLGRVLYSGSAAPDTGIPGDIGGHTSDRLLRAPCAGLFLPHCEIGTHVRSGEVVATVENSPVCAEISGVVRGLLPKGTPVHAGMKAGDIDPRGERSHCFTVSDKARAIAGGVLEALLALHQEAAGKEAHHDRTLLP